ncbi:MAG: magnesium transporter [Ignavibacteriae bacterium]|nr:MAG: magnesium transporter [Ignavibacteriota bacterium]
MIKVNEKKQRRAVIEVDEQLLNDITDLIQSKSDVLLKNIIADIYPSDIALIINNLDDENGLDLFKILPETIAPEVLLELNEHQRDYILDSLSIPQISTLVGEMDSDDATDIISELTEDIAQDVLGLMETEDSTEVKELLTYGENTAGGIMQKEFVDVLETHNIDQAVKEIKEEAKDFENFYHVWVTDNNRRLVGIISLKDIIFALDRPSTKIADIMDPEVISVDVNTDQEEVAKVFQKYDLVTVPVVDKHKILVGRISIDDIVDVIEEEFSEDVARIVGSDVEELQSKSPMQIAWMRLPWVLITLGMQFFAGLVIHFYDSTLTKVILLASFMPIISAISGNTGLQASAMTVRALATGHISLNRWWEPVKRSFQTSVILGFVCGMVIGIIGGMWYGKFIFGLVVGISMFVSINISALVGTSTPFISKRLGFDPAITVGPFETAFQDVVGITIFLTLATVALKWLI